MKLNEIITETTGEEDSLHIRRKAKILKDRGYKFIQGLYESGGGGIYQIIAYCKHPELWDPYKAPKDFEKTDTYALCWEYDPEYSTLNNAGRLFYSTSKEPTTDNPLDNIRDNFNNAAEWSELYWLEKLDLTSSSIVEKRFNEIFKAVTTKTPINRWDGAPRSDL